MLSVGRRDSPICAEDVASRCMKLATGKVVQGKVVVEGDALPEGAIVTVLSADGPETFEVPADLEVELAESLAQAARGEALPVADVLARLRRTI